MAIRVSAFRWVPPFAQGYVKDLRVRWALEEAGLPYEAVLIDRQIQGTDAYRQWQPFGQVPAYRDEEVEIFESGAILLHLATKSEALAPTDIPGRARVSAWVLAALNSVEPHAQAVIHCDESDSGETWVKYRQVLAGRLDSRLSALAGWLGAKPYLEDRFTAGDLVMASVLRELVDSGVLARFPALDAYRARCEARPAFGRAMQAQLQSFRENAPA